MGLFDDHEKISVEGISPKHKLSDEHRGHVVTSVSYFKHLKILLVDKVIYVPVRSIEMEFCIFISKDIYVNFEKK